MVTTRFFLKIYQNKNLFTVTPRPVSQGFDLFSQADYILSACEKVIILLDTGIVLMLYYHEFSEFKKFRKFTSIQIVI